MKWLQNSNFIGTLYKWFAVSIWITKLICATRKCVNIFFSLLILAGSSCCTPVTKHLEKAHPSLCDAEDAYGVDYLDLPVTSTPQTPTCKSSEWQDQPLSPIIGHSPTVQTQVEGNVCIRDVVTKLVVMFKMATTKWMQLQLIAYLLKVFI